MWKTRAAKDFLLTHQSVLHHAPQSLKESLHSSYHILLGQSSSSWQCILSARAPKTDGQPPTITSAKPEPEWSPLPKRWHSLTDAQGDISVDADFLVASQEGPLSSKVRKTVNWFSLLKSQSCRHLQLGLQSHERGQSTLLHHSPLGLSSWQHGRPLRDFQGAGTKCWLAGGGPFMNYNGHGMERRT